MIIYLHCEEQDSYGYQLEDVEEEPLLLLLLLFLADWSQGGLLEDYLTNRSVQCAVLSVHCAVCTVCSVLSEV